MNSRAVSPLLGIVLLVALTTVAALSMLLVSAAMIQDGQTTTEIQQVEESLSELAQTGDRIADGVVAEAEFGMHRSDAATEQIDSTAGEYQVHIERENGTEVLTDGTLGVYTYRRTDGTELAYQGGGVWRKDATGSSQVVRPPEFHYRSQPDPTLTLPIVRIDGESGPAPSDGSIGVVDRRDVYPANESHENPLHEGVVYLTVESEYCGGWEQFFRYRTDGAITESCATIGETGDGEVRVELSVPLRIDGIEDGVWTDDADIHKNADVKRVNEGNYDAVSIDMFVDHRREECEEAGYTDVSGTITESGLYCTRVIDDHITVDTDAAGGDVQIFAPNGMEDNNDIDVDGSGGAVSVFFGDDVEYGGGGSGTIIGNENDSTQTRLYFNSTSDFDQRGDGDIYALVYAPRSLFYVHASGSGTFEGAIVAQTVEIGSASVKLRYDPGFEDVVVTEEGAGEPFYYLHVSETKVRISG